MSDPEPAHPDRDLLWAQEAERRWEELRTDPSRGIPSEQVFAEARALLGAPTTAGEKEPKQ